MRLLQFCNNLILCAQHGHRLVGESPIRGLIADIYPDITIRMEGKYPDIIPGLEGDADETD